MTLIDESNRLENEARRLAEYEALKKMLIILAINFTSKTKLMEIPRGSHSYSFLRLENDKGKYYNLGSRRIAVTDVVELQPFFGMYIGYYQPLDTLVYWMER